VEAEFDAERLSLLVDSNDIEDQRGIRNLAGSP
jgi:hypothetical protein